MGLIELAALNKPIIMASGSLGGGNESAPFETITAAKLSLTVIDYPSTPISTTFALVPPTGQAGVVPTALAPSDVKLYPFDNQDKVEDRSPVSAFIPAGALSSGTCKEETFSDSCKRRVLFLVYTSSLFFQQSQSSPTTNSADSEEQSAQSSSDSGMNVVSANSLIMSIKIGTQNKVNLKESVSVTLTPLSGSVSRHHLSGSGKFSGKMSLTVVVD